MTRDLENIYERSPYHRCSKRWAHDRLAKRRRHWVMDDCGNNGNKTVLKVHNPKYCCPGGIVTVKPFPPSVPHPLPHHTHTTISILYKCEEWASKGDGCNREVKDLALCQQGRLAFSKTAGRQTLLTDLKHISTIST